MSDFTRGLLGGRTIVAIALAYLLAFSGFWVAAAPQAQADASVTIDGFSQVICAHGSSDPSSDRHNGNHGHTDHCRGAVGCCVGALAVGPVATLGLEPSIVSTEIAWRASHAVAPHAAFARGFSARGPPSPV